MFDVQTDQKQAVDTGKAIATRLLRVIDWGVKALCTIAIIGGVFIGWADTGGLWYGDAPSSRGLLMILLPLPGFLILGLYFLLRRTVLYVLMGK